MFTLYLLAALACWGRCAALGPGSPYPLVVGVDLGDDNSVVAVAGRSGVTVALNGMSGRQTPSAVCFTGQSRAMGENAVVAAAGTARVVKHFKDVLAAPGSNEALETVVHLGKDLKLHAHDIVQMILGQLMRTAQAAAPGATMPSGTVVVGVPSYFTQEDRQVIRNAALIRGLPLATLLDEGTAISMCYAMLGHGRKGQEEDEGELVTFVDIGYTAVQVTVTSISNSSIEVVGRGWKKGCGVGGVVSRMLKQLTEEMAKQGIDTAAPKAVARLEQAITRAVKTLSANKEAHISVECIDGSRDFTTTVTRDLLESACSVLPDEIAEACKDAMQEAGALRFQGKYSIELLGGGSYIPMLRRAVEGVFGEGTVRRTVSATESIAKGCALAAAQHNSLVRLRDFSLRDRLRQPLEVIVQGAGIEEAEEVVAEIASGTVLPCIVPVQISNMGAAVVVDVTEAGSSTPLASFDVSRLGRAAVAPSIQQLSFQVHLGAQGELSLDKAYFKAGEVMGQEDRGSVEEGEEEAEQKQEVGVKRHTKSSGQKLIHAHVQERLIDVRREEFLVEARELEEKLDKQDRQVQAAEEAQNDLEQTLFSARAMVQPWGELGAYLEQAEAKQALALIAKTEEWLSEGLMRSPRECLSEKRRIETVLVPAQARRNERAAVTEALEQLEQDLLVGEKRWRDRTGSMKARDIVALDKEMAAHEHWLSQARKKLDEALGPSSTEGEESYGAKSGRLPLRASDIMKRCRHLEKVIQGVLKKYPETSEEDVRG
ncbi:unnamed protein product [Chrysoparadoxa australica]